MFSGLYSIVTSLLAAFTDGYSTYAGGKAPVEDFTRAAAKEFGPRGISVTAIGPGPMDTPFFYGQETRAFRYLWPRMRFRSRSATASYASAYRSCRPA